MKFPLFIDLENKNVLVVGGGEIASRRIKTLLMFGAKVKVVAKKIKDESFLNYIEYEIREFKDSDINNMFMVIAATDKREVNHKIYELCKDKEILISVADCKEECNFYFPAVCVNERLSIGLVSDGNQHKLVRKTAEKIRRLINEEID